MRILERSMRNDAKLSEFMTVKLNERSEFKAEEAAKRDKGQSPLQRPMLKIHCILKTLFTKLVLESIDNYC